jgi:hypothetical protein
MEHKIPTDKFKMNNQIFSDMSLVVVGGDSVKSKLVHNALCLLNRRINYRIEKICADTDACFLYHQLLNSVFIFKCASKMIDTDPESDDEDGDEESDDEDCDEESDDEDGDEDSNESNIYENIFSRIPRST